MVALGTAFYRHGHPYFIISDPAKNDGKVLCVNLTTVDEDCIDDECILNENDYAWIEVGHPTSVAFSKAVVWDSALIDQCLQDGKLIAANPPIVSATTVAKVAGIAKNSRELSPAMRAMV